MEQSEGRGASQLQGAEQTLETALSREPEIRELTDQAARLEAAKPRYAELEQLRKAQNAGEKRHKTLRETIGETEALLADARKRQSETAALLEQEKELPLELERSRRELEDLGSRKDAEEEEQETSRKDALMTLHTQAEAFQTARKDHEKAAAAYLAAAGKADLAQKAYQSLYRAFLDAQAGILALGLQEGEPCPVCGSRTHPEPAPLADQAPTQEAVDEAQEKADKAAKAAATASARAGRLDGLRAQQEQMLGEAAGKLLG